MARTSPVHRYDDVYVRLHIVLMRDNIEQVNIIGT